MTKVWFYDPHPGFGGAAIPLPQKMKDLADSLDGKILALEDAIEMITPAADSLGGRVRVLKDHHYFLFEMGGAPEHVKHAWRLIRYNPHEKD